MRISARSIAELTPSPSSWSRGRGNPTSPRCSTRQSATAPGGQPRAERRPVDDQRQLPLTDDPPSPTPCTSRRPVPHAGTGAVHQERRPRAEAELTMSNLRAPDRWSAGNVSRETRAELQKPHRTPDRDALSKRVTESRRQPERRLVESGWWVRRRSGDRAGSQGSGDRWAAQARKARQATRPAQGGRAGGGGGGRPGWISRCRPGRPAGVESARWARCRRRQGSSQAPAGSGYRRAPAGLGPGLEGWTSTTRPAGTPTTQRPSVLDHDLLVRDRSPINPWVSGTTAV